jgi:Flp pilus assembly protein TadG
MKALRRWRERVTDTGASAVEFALVVPLLILLVFGIIDFGGLFAQQLALNNGVRQGARAAVVAGSPSTQTCAQIVSGAQSASGPAIAFDTSRIAIKTTIISSTTGATTRTPCDNSASFQVTSSSTVKPCVGSYDLSTNTANSLKVEAQYQSTFLVPIPLPISAPMLRATAVYKCEFNS